MEETVRRVDSAGGEQIPLRFGIYFLHLPQNRHRDQILCQVDFRTTQILALRLHILQLGQFRIKIANFEQSGGIQGKVGKIVFNHDAGHLRDLREPFLRFEGIKIQIVVVFYQAARKQMGEKKKHKNKKSKAEPISSV